MVLDPLGEAHAQALFPVLNDAKLWRFTDDECPVSKTLLAQRYRRLESRRSPDGSQLWLNWVIVCAAEVVGFVQATVTGDVAEIAYVVGRTYQSRGYAGHAVRAMLEYLETVRGVRTAYATIDGRNRPSQRLLDRLGFGVIDSTDSCNVRWMKMLGR